MPPTTNIAYYYRQSARQGAILNPMLRLTEVPVMYIFRPLTIGEMNKGWSHQRREHT